MNENNLLDIDKLIQDFLSSYKVAISLIHKNYFNTTDSNAVAAFTLNITDDLRTGCVSFLNKNDSNDELFQYLFYITNSCAKKMSSSQSKKAIGYFCPGCLYFDKQIVVTSTSSLLECNNCSSMLLNNSLSSSDKLFYGTFAKHNKIGYKCPECNRFIPNPLKNNNYNITCPYFDCYFVGNFRLLKKMQHPSFKYNPEDLKSDVIIEDKTTSSCDKLMEKEDLEKKVNLLLDIIESQNNSAAYSGSDFTLIHKVSTYQAFKSMIIKYPEDMIDYLLYNSRSGGFQHKIFQEYVSILEKSLPVCFKKGGKVYRIDSLLDENLNIFDGISTFDAIISDKLEVKNNTSEIYIGGRKASYAKPYYIGKLLSVFDKNTKLSLINSVKEYSFSKIILKDINPGTEVVVTHLRIPPHYQMGGMVYINRLRKKIVDRAIKILRDDNEEKAK